MNALDTGEQDMDELDVFLYNHVCVHVRTCTCWTHTQASWTQMSCTDELDIDKLDFCQWTGVHVDELVIYLLERYLCY